MAADIIPFDRGARSVETDRTSRLFRLLSDAVRARPEGQPITGASFGEILNSLNEALANDPFA